MMGDRTVLTLEEIQLQLSSSPEYSDFEQINGQNNPKLKVQWSVVEEGSNSHQGLLYSPDSGDGDNLGTVTLNSINGKPLSKFHSTVP